MNIDDQILYHDNHLLVVNKPAGILVQGDHTGDETLLELSKQYVKHQFNKPGNVYLGLVQRLDRPVSGIVVFARTSKAAGRLSDMVRTRSFKKTYWALVEGKTAAKDTLTDYIDRNGVTSIISTPDKGKKAVLSFLRLRHSNNTSWIEIDLHTGRHHQIRVQFAHRGHPVLGDFRYGSKIKFGNKALALHACHVRFKHPVRDEEMEFKINPDNYWPDYVTKEQ